jgi:hypothetical protein
VRLAVPHHLYSNLCAKNPSSLILLNLLIPFIKSIKFPE